MLSVKTLILGFNTVSSFTGLACKTLILGSDFSDSVVFYGGWYVT